MTDQVNEAVVNAMSDKQIMFTALCRIALGQGEPQAIADEAIAASRKAAIAEHATHPARGVVDEDRLRAAYVEAHDAEESWLEETGHLYDPGLPVDAGIRAVVRALQAAQPALPAVPEGCRFFASGPETSFFVAKAHSAEFLIDAAGFDRDEWTVTDLATTPKDQPAQKAEG